MSIPWMAEVSYCI